MLFVLNKAKTRPIKLQDYTILAIDNKFVHGVKINSD